MAQQVHHDSFVTYNKLPKHVRPDHYELRLKPNLIDFTFEGTVRINLSRPAGCESFKQIVLHANELVIFSGEIIIGSESTALKTVTYNKNSETATLKFEKDVPEFSHAVLVLNFTGILNDKMEGFYRAKFVLDGIESYLATTHFEPTGARRAFPCWDEPDKKATFKVSMVYDSVKFDAISNTPVKEDVTLNSSEFERTFETTPIMSTYLLAYAVGRFDYLEAFDERKKRRIRVYTPPGIKEQGEFALDVACKSLVYYEELFGIEYPLSKLDLIAIPDFPIGAMENWGLITYRESCLLVDSKNTTQNGKISVALVVAHEIAHQWFGNLVTMEWWTDLWLKEGFATFMEYLCVDHILPDYDTWSQFVALDYSIAMQLDSLHNSHPVEVPVNHPSEICEIFDAISYKKGASVIRMLYQYIGHKDFQKGIHNYLLEHSYKNAITKNLWQAFEAASNKPICDLMSTWTMQKGFPWLNLNLMSSSSPSSSTIPKENDIKIRLHQSKFTADGQTSSQDLNLTWAIPIQLIKGADLTILELGLLTDKEAEFIIPKVGESWIKLNPGTVGLYHTFYPTEMLQKLSPVILDQTLPPLDRLGLLADSLALCQAGHFRIMDLFKLLDSYKLETDYNVWCIIDLCFEKLSILLAEVDYLDKLQAFGRKFYQNIFKIITWLPQAGEHHSHAMMRSMILHRLINFNDEDVIAESIKRFHAHYDGTDLLQADLRGAVYKAVSKHGNEASFDRLFTIIDRAELQEEKVRATCALGYASETKRLDRVIAFVLSDKVRLQDKLSVIRAIGLSKPHVAWKLFQDRKDLFKEMFGFHISKSIKFSVENLVGESAALEVGEFFKINKFPGGERTIQQSLETIRLYGSWLERDGDHLRSILSTNQ